MRSSVGPSSSPSGLPSICCRPGQSSPTSTRPLRGHASFLAHVLKKALDDRIAALGCTSVPDGHHRRPQRAHRNRGRTGRASASSLALAPHPVPQPASIRLGSNCYCHSNSFIESTVEAGFDNLCFDCNTSLYFRQSRKIMTSIMRGREQGEPPEPRSLGASKACSRNLHVVAPADKISVCARAARCSLMRGLSYPRSELPGSPGPNLHANLGLEPPGAQASRWRHVRSTLAPMGRRTSLIFA